MNRRSKKSEEIAKLNLVVAELKSVEDVLLNGMKDVRTESAKIPKFIDLNQVTEQGKEEISEDLKIFRDVATSLEKAQLDKYEAVKKLRLKYANAVELMKLKEPVNAVAMCKTCTG